LQNQTNRRAEQVLPGKVGFYTSERGKVVGTGVRMVNTVQKMCSQACKCNNDIYCNYFHESGEGRIKGSSGGVNSSMI
jgi:hypothetical protein